MKVSISNRFAKMSLVVMLLVILGLNLTSVIVTPEFYSLFLSQVVPPKVLGFNIQDGVAELNVDQEQSVPTWFSSSLLLLCSLLLAAIAFIVRKTGGRYVPHWAAMSMIFVFLSLDEMMSVHERLIGPLRTSLQTGGLLHFAWVIPAVAFVIIFVLAYSRFLLNLPATFRWLFIAGGGIYVSGTLGLEMLGGLWADSHGEANPTYRALTTVEEFLEMIGAALFLYALMRYTGHLEEAGEKEKANLTAP